MDHKIYTINNLHFCDGKLREDDFGRVLSAQDILSRMVYPNPSGGCTVDGTDYKDTIFMESRHNLIEAVKTICQAADIRASDLDL